MMKETELYAPIKAYLEGQGYDVKAEVKDCDLVAIRGAEDPVIVELKLSLSIALMMQGIDRQTMTDAVYVAVPAGKGKRWAPQVKDAVKLCRRLGLGLISVRFDAATPSVLVHCDAGPYRPRKVKARKAALLKEFERRVGDHNTGGQNKRKIMTAYRQDALRIAVALSAGPNKPRILAAELVLSVPLAYCRRIITAGLNGWNAAFMHCALQGMKRWKPTRMWSKLCKNSTAFDAIGLNLFG